MYSRGEYIQLHEVVHNTHADVHGTGSLYYEHLLL